MHAFIYPKLCPKSSNFVARGTHYDYTLDHTPLCLTLLLARATQLLPPHPLQYSSTDFPDYMGADHTLPGMADNGTNCQFLDFDVDEPLENVHSEPLQLNLNVAQCDDVVRTNFLR
jgi:hypothetical protein